MFDAREKEKEKEVEWSYSKSRLSRRRLRSLGYLYVCTFISFFFQLLEDRGEKRLISKYFLFLTRRSWNIFSFREDGERGRERNKIEWIDLCPGVVEWYMFPFESLRILEHLIFPFETPNEMKRNWEDLCTVLLKILRILFISDI